MLAKLSKRLVVDTDVLVYAAGREGGHPNGKPCREALIGVLEACHRVVASSDIAREWKRHPSGFLRRWRVAMAAHRKPIEPVQPARDDALREEILATASRPKDRRDMEKDLPLVEAALAADAPVVSCDETVRDLFAAASARVGALRNIVWVNPVRPPAEGMVAWLEDGAEPRKDLRLGQAPR